MVSNIINGIFLIIFLLYCYKRPITGIICVLIVILSLNSFFYSFGFAFGAGEKYLSNIAIIVFAYAFGCFIKEIKLKKFDILDMGLIVFIVAVFIVSLYVSEFTANLGVIVKSCATPIIFYFVGKIFALEKNIENNYLRLRKYLLFLGPYYILLVLLEYLTEVNFFPALLTRFGSLVGASENVIYFDPVEKYESMIHASFHRVMGPLLEPTETALVMMIVFIMYLAWTNSDNWRKFRKIVLIMLPGLIALSTSRTVILSTGVVIGASYLLPLRRNLKILAAFGCMVIVFLVIYFSGVWLNILEEESYNNPFLGRLAEERDVEARKVAYEEAWQLVKDRILLGVGEGIEVDILPAQGEPTGLTVHNYFLDNLLFKGVLLSAGLLIIYFILIRGGFKVYRHHENSLTGNIAFTYLLLTVGMLTFYLATQEKLQIASLFWFYGGMLREIRLQEGI